MKLQWEIWTFDFPWGSHPAVIITPSEDEFINVLACQSQQARRLPKSYETILDTADGLNWPTLCRLTPFWTVKPSDLFNQRGKVTTERRREVGNKIIRL